MMIIAWFVAVSSCQQIMYDAPKSWGGKRNFICATNKHDSKYATGGCFPWDWCRSKGVYLPETKGGFKGRQPTPGLFKLIIFITWFFNLLVMVVPFTFFVILVPMSINNGATTDYPEWAETKE